MRARLALLVSGTVCELREVKLSDKPTALLAASPKGTVPVLVLPGGVVIDESIDIMRWALRQNDPENWLAREDACLIAANDGPFKHHLDRTKYQQRFGEDPAIHRAAALALLENLEARLAITANLSGEQRGLTDAAICPFIRQFAAIDRPWFDSLALPGVQRWLGYHLTSPLFDAAMLGVPVWREGEGAGFGLPA
jgi:glutathione S-transferase